MKVREYLKIAHQTDTLQSKTPHDEINPRLGLAGEVGYLLTALKKEVRDDAPTATATRETVKDELGDITWYAATIAKRAGLDFQADILLGNLIRVETNYTDANQAPAPLLTHVLKTGGEVSTAIKAGPSAVSTFDAYQNLAVKTSRYKSKQALVPYLVRIWGNVGNLLDPFETNYEPKTEDKNAVARSLGDIMWYVAGFAHVYGLSLDDVLSQNAEKIVSAFPAPSQKKPTPLFDEGLGPLKQFPRRFNVDFVEYDSNTVVMLVNGVRVGDPLTDNSYEIDGYRYHDSIHLAFIAVLGWSPVMRGLMKRKRKGVGNVDEVEDGARAQIVEEMIVKIAHTYAVGFDEKKLLDGKKHVNLNLLKEILGLAEGLEVAGGRPGVKGCKYWEWQKAILDGFRIYNRLRRHKRGRIEVDLKKRSVTFVRLPKSKGTRMLVEKP